MKRSLLFIFVLTLMAAGAMSQSIDDSFFQKVSYVGAFDGINDWTAGWTEWDPVNANYPEPTATKGNGQFSRSEGLHITTSETWSGVIKLDGWVYVDAGATLTIAPGTIIRGTNKSVLSVDKGGKIMAVGSSAEPIVFTSAQGAGFRANSDWAGLVINGNAINNLAGGSGTAEGGIGSPYGGIDNNDNSGALAYVRIEFAGYDIASGNEVNGLTLNSVGSGTTINYIQVSHSGDDGFEFFGGSVNAKYLISYKTEDDDFDTDNGYCGMVQFAVILRDPTIVDTDTANGFESDNDKDGSDASPKTKAIFSNLSGFGAAKDLATYNSLPQNHKDGATMRIRRNSRISVYNSLYLGWGRGLRFESSGTQTAANASEMTVKNTFIGDVFGDKFKTDDAVMTAAQLEAWFLEATKKNKVLAAGSDAKITDPFNATEPNFQPMAGSPVFNASYWYKESEPASIDNSFFEQVDYVGAFDGVNDWTAGWTEWDPVNANYPEPTTTKGNGQFSRSEGLHITASETWSGVIKLDGWVYVDAGATLTIAPGTIIRGTNKSVLSVEKGGKIMAVGSSAEPIVFTSSQGAGFRSNSDWAGLVINGNGINNLAGGSGTAEGGIGSPYGGADNTDNSGVLAYVRIEFPGYEIATGNEVNGLTLNSVGSGTTIDHVQVSYSGDDGVEFFGGAVNAKHLISYKTEDDDFDTDNGYSGMVQFAVILRDPTIVDTDTANGFESDNDKDGSDASPKTKAIFSNLSGFGAAKDLATYNSLPQNHKDGATMRIRRNSRISVYNSLYLGWGRGLRFESSGTQTAANAGEMTVKNTFIGDVFGDKFKTDDAVMTAAQLETWFLEATKKNKVLEAGSDAKITDPFSQTAPNFQPMAGSPVFNASYWAVTPVNDLYANSQDFSVTNYPNPFNGRTQIELSLTKPANVRLTVINMSGAIVSDIYHGELYEGIHKFSFETGMLPRGIYFGKVSVNNEIKTLKMVAQ